MKSESYVRSHAFVQAVLFVGLFFSVLNIAYTITVVAIIRSWLLTWWVDRRFPFCLIPLWAFLLVSTVFFMLGIYYYPRNRPRLAFDGINKFLICVTIGILVWIAVALGLTHVLYIGDFNVLQIIQNVFSGEPRLELPVETIDVFPTLGDTVLIGYILSFLFSFFASWRALRTVRQDRQIFVLGKPNVRQ
ncbi:MAG TPA: hypothetical protein VJ529_02575 [Candidatus Bathyarchaeia archaeon]|nr:hypothetical protein [Candidatus Bathyarchaeia archaeon]